jgi:hypothetical protein
VSTLKVNNLEDLGADPVVTNGVIEKAALPSGSILQVVSTVKTDTFSASLTAGSTAAITGLSASITPSATSSKILVLYSVSLGVPSGGSGINLILRRNSTAINLGDASSSRTRVTSGGGVQGADAAAMSVGSFQFLDSPATTSAITYDLLIQNARNASETHHVNRGGGDADNAGAGRATSQITVMEVAG